MSAGLSQRSWDACAAVSVAKKVQKLESCPSSSHKPHVNDSARDLSSYVNSREVRTGGCFPPGLEDPGVTTGYNGPLGVGDPYSAVDARQRAQSPPAGSMWNGTSSDCPMNFTARMMDGCGGYGGMGASGFVVGGGGSVAMAASGLPTHLGQHRRGTDLPDTSQAHSTC